MNLDTHDWGYSHRLRSLFGVTSRERAWKPKTWHALGGAEPFFAFEAHQIDLLRLSAGIGRVLTDRLRVEFIYYSNLTRPNDGGLQHTENLFQLNFHLERKPARTKPKTKHENMKTLKTTRRWTRRVGIAALMLLVIALCLSRRPQTINPTSSSSRVMTWDGPTSNLSPFQGGPL